MEKEIKKTSDLLFMEVHPFGLKMPAMMAGSWALWAFGGIALFYLTYELQRSE